LTINVGLIGYGYWGPNLARNFAEDVGSRLLAIADLDAHRLAQARLRHPASRMTHDHRELLEDPNIDAIAIATPVRTHFDLAMQALHAGKHVLVEKPLASSLDKIARLIDEATNRDLVILVDHTFVYTPAVRKMRELLDDGSIGEPYYYDSTRINLGLFQQDVNVLWDLAVHDLSIMDYVLNVQPTAVSATGMNHVAGAPENLAYLTLFYGGNLIAHIHVNWLAPVKVRRAILGGTRRMIVYDDLEPSEKIKIYDKGVTLNRSDGEHDYQMRVGYRMGDMWAPRLDVVEALHSEVQHFTNCIEGTQQPLTGAPQAYRVHQILDAASQSLKERGQIVELRAEAALV
jgi:predicted dehydrogenase